MRCDKAVTNTNVERNTTAIVLAEFTGLAKRIKPMIKHQHKLRTLPKDHWILAACLNLVQKRGITPDEAIDRVTAAGIPFNLMCQWSNKRQELDILAVFYIARLEDIPLTDEQHQFLWNLFGNESLLGMGAGSIRDYENIMVRSHLETLAPPPTKPNWYVHPGKLQPEETLPIG